MTQPFTGHAGEQALAALRPFGVDVMFTLNGGHVWPLYDAARNQGVRVVDTRHEQTATFAAEAYAKLTRTPGPRRADRRSGRHQRRLGHHLGVVQRLAAGRARRAGAAAAAGARARSRSSTTCRSWRRSPSRPARCTDAELAAKQVHEAAATAMTPHRGPVFLDFPLDVFGPAEAELPDPVSVAGAEPDPDEVAALGRLLAAAERPAFIVGSDVYWGGAWEQLRAAVEHLRIPCCFNGLGRGCLPADHELAFLRTRGLLKTDADLVVVRRHAARLPPRLRPLRRGRGRPRGRRRVAARRPRRGADGGRRPRRASSPPWPPTRAAVPTTTPGSAGLRDAERAAAAADAALLAADADPIKPTRVYGELARRLERDAVVICDGGDFASYAGKYVEVFTPGCWLDTGPYGCLGNGPGYAIAARVARPAVAGRGSCSATAPPASA